MYYFVPKTGGHSLLDDYGLRDRFIANPTVIELRNGPSGASGTVFCEQQRLPDVIRWVDVYGEDWWLGIDDTRPPTPSSLGRPMVISGVPVRLADGNDWVIPLVLPCTDRDPKRATTLPQIAAFVDGKPGWCVDPRYRSLQKQAVEMLAAWKSEHVHVPPCLDYCIDLLSVWYRVQAPEVIALNLLDQAVAGVMAMVSFDARECAICMAAEKAKIEPEEIEQAIA